MDENTLDADKMQVTIETQVTCDKNGNNQKINGFMLLYNSLICYHL